MLAGDIMTSPAICVQRNAPVADVARAMVDHGISAVFVVNKENKPIGIVSEQDLLRRADLGTGHHHSRWADFFLTAASQAAEYVKEHGKLAKDVMTKKVLQVDRNTPIAEVAVLLEAHDIKRVAVVDEDKIVGVVSRANIVRALSMMPPGKVGPRSDRTIRKAALAEIERHRWQPIAKNVIVRDGVLHVWGTVGTPKERRAIQVALQGVAGVKSVKDHMRTYSPGINAWM